MVLERAVASSGLEYKKIAEDVFLFENFLSESQQLELIDVALKADWTLLGKKELQEYALEEFGTADIETLLSQKKIYKQPMFDKIFKIDQRLPILRDLASKLSKIAPEGCVARSFDSMQRHTAGSGLEAHIDQADDLEIKYGAIAYVQHAESGGEIYFHPLELSVLPPERSLIVFRSDYLHEVLPVSGDRPRYALPSYFYAQY